MSHAKESSIMVANGQGYLANLALTREERLLQTHGSQVPMTPTPGSGRNQSAAMYRSPNNRSANKTLTNYFSQMSDDPLNKPGAF